MENFQELFPSGYLSFSAFKGSAGPHCVLVVDPGSGMITADYYTRSTALTARPIVLSTCSMGTQEVQVHGW